MDNLTPEQRLKNMRNIKATETKPEEIVRKYLYSRGIRYRKNYNKLPGKPDIYIPKYKTAIFVNGCFWHVHDCGKFVMPKTNQEFWQKKFEGNVERDQRHKEELTNMGINVIVIWECGLENKIRQETLDELYEMIITEEEEMRLRELWLRCDYWEEFNEE